MISNTPVATRSKIEALSADSLPVGPRPRILLDLLAYGPNDGGFTTVIHSLLESATRLPEFEFGILYHRDYREIFSRWSFARHEVKFPRQVKFLSSLWLTPQIVRRHLYDAVHSDISLLSPWVKVPASMRVCDLYSLINPAVSPRKLRQRLFAICFDWFYIRSIRKASVVGALSECTRRDLDRIVGRSNGVHLMPLAVPPPLSGTVSRGWPIADQPLRLLFVGSVVPRKNLRLLLQALSQVRRTWTLDVVGNIWWGAKELEPYADDSRIRVHGFVPRAVLLDFYRTAHALVIPSLYEGFGLPAAEAINSGCLALTSSGSAFDEYIPTGCRFDPQDGARLTRLIEDMGIESCERLWQESFQAVARYTLEAQTDAYQVVFSELVKHVKK